MAAATRVAALVWMAACIVAQSRASGREPSMPNYSPRSDDKRPGCPSEMVRVDNICVDRWEIMTVDRKTRRELSPYYPPLPSLLRRTYDVWQVERLNSGDARARLLPLPDLPEWQLTDEFEPMAVSRGGVIPQGYLSCDIARRACSNAGKRLCRLDEWKRACRGQQQRQFPYGNAYVGGACNVWRLLHAAAVLHGNASVGHLDPRMNLVWERESDPLLHTTGGTPACVSQWRDDGLFDMVGNLDEWVDDDGGGFVGGFYARATTKGCDSRVTAHPASYFDYSTGARCCRDI
jgi:formylglycine-generating enzyme